MLRLILNSLRLSPGRYVLMAVPIVLGAMAFVILAWAYLIVGSVLETGASSLAANEIVITPQHVDIPFIFRKSEKKELTEEDATAFQSLTGVSSVEIIKVLQAPASVRISILGQVMESDTPIYGIDGSREFPGTTKQPDQIAIVLSRSFVSLMGTTLSDAFGFPRMSEDLLVGRDVTVITGASTFFPSRTEKAQEWSAKIVGLSSRVPLVGLTVQMVDLERLAQATGSLTRISSVLLTLTPDTDRPAILHAIESKGFSTDTTSQQLGKAQGITMKLRTIGGVIGLLLLSFITTTVMAVVWSDVHLYTRQTGIMRSFGATTKHIRWFFLGKVTLVTLLSALLGSGIGTLLSSMAWPTFLGSGISLPGYASTIGTMIMTILFLLLTSLLSALPPILRANRLPPVYALGEEI